MVVPWMARMLFIRGFALPLFSSFVVLLSLMLLLLLLLLLLLSTTTMVAITW